VVNANGLPIDTHGTVVESHNPLGQPQYPDRDGDLFDEVYHVDTRLQPLPHAGATMHLDRYAVVVPSGTRGPVAVTVAVYYQPFAAVATQKLLENLAGTDLDGMLEPCVLKGTRDGRWSTVKPAVGEGAPPVPVQITSRMTPITRTADAPPSTATTYLRADATEVYEDVVVEVFFSEPVTGVDVTTMPLTDAQGTAVPASVAQTAMTPGGSSRIRSFCGGERPIAPVWPPGCVHFAQNCLGQALT